MAKDELEKSLAGTPAMDDVERLRYDNHTSVKGRSKQRTPTQRYVEGYEQIQWDGRGL